MWPNTVRFGNKISWFVMSVTSILIWLDLPGFTARSFSGIASPVGHGDSSSGSKMTGVRVTTGQWLTRQEILIVSPCRIK